MLNRFLAALFAATLLCSPSWALFNKESAGVTDHGALTGLSDNDHPQYANEIVQVVCTTTTTGASTTTVLPVDGTIPQNTEGSELFTRAITPTSSSNKLLIEVFIPGIDRSANGTVGTAIFQDTTADALTAMPVFVTTTGTIPVSFRYEMTAGTTSSTTFKFRYGPHSAATAYANRTSSSATPFGSNKMQASLCVTEVAQ